MTSESNLPQNSAWEATPGGEPQSPHERQSPHEQQSPLRPDPQPYPYPGAHQDPYAVGEPGHTVIQGSVVPAPPETATGGGYPPPPPYQAGYAAAGASPAPHRRRRMSRPFALAAAVALAAGVIGGGAGALIGHATDHSSNSVTAAAAVNASAVDGSVAGVYKAVNPSVVEITATLSDGTSTGAGIIITSNGQIVTNNHVISGAQSVSVTYSSGKKASASVVGTDAKKDLALIKVNGASGLPAAVLGDSSGLAVGDQVVAIGSPEGLSDTVTSGIVSALNRDVTVPVEEEQQQSQDQGGQGFGGGSGGLGGGSGSGGSDQWPFSFGGNQYNGSTGSSTTTYKAIQTDASLNPGNSGGALINMSGQIVGINSAMYSGSSDSSSSSDAGSVGLGFAIPINTVKSDLSYLQSGGDQK
ncbi:putative serine protease PepD [Actinacidiphila yanglinensis]|uniref:Putative serine protease PepD n=1 Tax=Actinacidiphila yanglinensis TaxID=310779 RepID=A0A1H6DTS8_9ACTN|nr:trypsin-like peptidase domain-containing protein [Actinacidiphila yanglinensis]SEG88792.1 putative serine protease PepD [Actinacidiphila yanglinensis]